MLTLETSPGDVTAVKYRVGDPIDFDRYAFEALVLRTIEVELSRQTQASRQELGRMEQDYIRPLDQCRVANNASLSPSVGGQSMGALTVPMRYWPISTT